VLFIVRINWLSILCSSENDAEKKKLLKVLPFIYTTGTDPLLRLKRGSDGNKIRIFLYESFVNGNNTRIFLYEPVTKVTPL
jgi:hypothetical protein